MKKDMHLYGTFAIAAAAGFDVEDAALIARTAAEVDHSFYDHYCNVFGAGPGTACSAPEKRVETIAGIQSFGKDHQKRIWPPFHFPPALNGQTGAEERMLCGPTGPVFEGLLVWGRNSLKDGNTDRRFGLVRVGLACHVLCDAFSHAGFSGIATDLNRVRAGGVRITFPETDVLRRLQASAPTDDGDESELPAWLRFDGAGMLDKALPVGHLLGADAAPDIPFIRWEAEFEQRGRIFFDNPERYAAAIKAMFEMLLAARGAASPAKPWLEIDADVRDTIAVMSDKKGRSKAWQAIAKKWTPQSGQIFNDKVLKDRIGLRDGMLSQAEHWEIHAFNAAAKAWLAQYQTLMQQNNEEGRT